MEVFGVSPGVSLGSVDWNAINGLKGLTGQSVKTEGTESTNRTQTFDSILETMLDTYKETNANIKASEQFQLDIATGVSDDIVGLTLALEKAKSSLDFTVQITNRILESYREIMRMQA